jgi:hypothetical protein
LPLAEPARSVRTREDLVAFVADRKADLDARPEDWVNADLPSFLEAMTAWIRDREGCYLNTGQKVSELTPWRILADVLIAARMCE